MNAYVGGDDVLLYALLYYGFQSEGYVGLPPAMELRVCATHRTYKR